MSWKILYSKYALKDAEKISKGGLKTKIQELLALLAENPFKIPPPYEKLVGDLQGLISRRITIQHRLVYHVIKEQKLVRVLRMCSHYE